MLFKSVYRIITNCLSLYSKFIKTMHKKNCGFLGKRILLSGWEFYEHERLLQRKLYPDFPFLIPQGGYDKYLRN